MIDSVIFDLDGTLWDATEQIAACWAQSLPWLSHPMISKIMGMTPGEAASALSVPLSEVNHIQQKELLYLAGNPGVLYPGVSETISNLHEHGLRCFIASNCQKGYIEQFLACYPELHFDGYTSWGDTNQTKAENVSKLIQCHHLTPVMVGDTYGDLMAAEANHLIFIRALYGFGKYLPPSLAIKSMGDLPILLDMLKGWLYV